MTVVSSLIQAAMMPTAAAARVMGTTSAWVSCGRALASRLARNPAVPANGKVLISRTRLRMMGPERIAKTRQTNSPIPAYELRMPAMSSGSVTTWACAMTRYSVTVPAMSRTATIAVTILAPVDRCGGVEAGCTPVTRSARTILRADRSPHSRLVRVVVPTAMAMAMIGSGRCNTSVSGSPLPSTK